MQIMFDAPTEIFQNQLGVKMLFGGTPLGWQAAKPPENASRVILENFKVSDVGPVKSLSKKCPLFGELRDFTEM